MKNREIKFRAWDKKNKKMICEALIIKNIGLGEGSVLVDGRTQKGNELIWMQFTGLKDKNGKMVFEGDIVKGCFNEKDVEDWIWLSLTENEKSTGTKIFEISIPDVFQHPMPFELEIIGNIYEDNSLLEKI